ncbi:ATP-binding cassette domain-containing protein [Clostridium nigeriense]|uniref:ATP-binding cassette domain-containing protein n=1 Tax=Clostridium nigeriense TaxID=1805470 RepID=UPI003D356D0B
MKATVSTLIVGFNLISQVILLVVTIFLSINNLTPIGAVLSVGNLAGSFFSGIGAVIKSISILKSSNTLFENFSVKYDNISLKNIESITFKNISYNYSDKQVLYDINISFEKGHKYVITGESRSGKSTLLKILIGFLKDYNGNVLYDNTELREVSPTSIYNNISYIDQNIYLFNGTIKDNITLGQDFSDDDLYEALTKSCLINFINELPNAINTIIKENGKNISGGQRQRIALARALIRKINFIILDEGTSALDKENAKEIEDTLISSKDLCVIFVTHNLRNEILPKVTAYSI